MDEDRRERDRRVRLRRLGRQIALARDGLMNQEELGVRLGEYLDREIPQTTVSRWEKGLVDLGVEQVRALELVLELRPGSLMAGAGYLKFERVSIKAIRALIMTDPELHPSQRSSVLSMYESFRDISQQIYGRDSRP